MRSNDRVRSLCKTPFVCHLDFNTGTQHPLITQPALLLCTCWSLCHLCSLTKASSRQLLIWAALLEREVPRSIPWKPLCLCPCAKKLQLLLLARILAKYWWLPVENQSVKTIWEETSFSGDDSRAKQNHRQCGGNPDPTQPPYKQRAERTSKRRRQQTDSLHREARPERTGGNKEDVDT